MIEPRPIPHLAPLIIHMISVAPLDWCFLFIGTNESVMHVNQSRAVKYQQDTGKLVLTVLPEPWEASGQEKIARVLTDIRFYDEFLPDVQWVLKYGYDTILCANSEKSVDDWMEWDWAGTGGLTLRRVSTVRRFLRDFPRTNDSIPEGEWFGSGLPIMPGARVAPEIQTQAAAENTGNIARLQIGYDRHQLSGPAWGDAAKRREILDYCPELSLIMDMKLEVERCEGHQ